MTSVISFAKKYRHLFVFALFAALVGRAAFSVCVHGEDYILAAKYADSVSSALSYAARDLGEGYAAALLHLGLVKLPLFISRAFIFVCTLLTAALAAAIAAGCGRHGRWVDHERFGAALIFVSALFSAIPLTVLRFSVFDFGGAARFVAPCMLVLLWKFLSDRIDFVWILPVVALAAALFSYQAALAVAIVAGIDAIFTGLRREIFLAPLISTLLAFAAFVLHVVSGWLPSFPFGVSRLWMLRLFAGSIIDVGGFFPVILIFAVFTVFIAIRRMISFRFEQASVIEVALFIALGVTALLSVAALVGFFPVFSLFSLSGTLTVAPIALMFVALALYFAFSLIAGEDSVSAPFAAAAFAALAVTYLTGTFGGKSFYIPMILAAVVLSRLFFEVIDDLFACAVCGILLSVIIAAQNLSAPHFVAAAAVIIAVALISLSPFFRRLRLNETLAVIAAFFVMFTIGRGYIAAADVKEQNARAIYAHGGKSEAPLILAVPEDLKYEYPECYLGDEGIEAFKKYYGIGEKTRVFFVSDTVRPSMEQIGDVNGDGKVNARDSMLFMSWLEE